MSNFQLLEKLD